jgi:hypothetical protein
MRLRTRLAALASIPALALGVALATATAGSASTANVSFSSSAGNSAHWNADHTALVFDMNNASAPKGQGGYGYAIANLNGTSSTLPANAPTMEATGFAAGTPRLDICLSSGGCVFGYPGPGGIITWDSNNGSVPYGSTWATVQADEASYTVTSVYVVADGSQAVPYEATVTSLSYGGATYVP